jgi:hypothetical protein
MATITYNISATVRSDAGVFQTSPITATFTVADNYRQGRLTVLEASATTIPIGDITTPRLAQFRNADPDNYIVILDDATEIARIPAGQGQFVFLPAGVDLKAQANTDDCVMDFAVFEAA